MTHTRHKLALLGALYLSQGLPYGFFTQALPALLRQLGRSLPEIGAASLLALPWALKFLWAPLVDRYWSARLGRRRSWILPLQALTAAFMAANSAFRVRHHAENAAVLRQNTSNITCRTVWVIRIAERNTAIAFQHVERGVVCEEVTVMVRNRYDDFAARLILGRESRAVRADGEAFVAADKVQSGVS